MKVTVYVNWNVQRVMTEEEYKEEIERRAEEYCKNDENFAKWLDESYSALELYDIEGKQREEVRRAFLAFARDEEENGGFGWYCEDFTFEI